MQRIKMISGIRKEKGTQNFIPTKYPDLSKTYLVGKICHDFLKPKVELLTKSPRGEFISKTSASPKEHQ